MRIGRLEFGITKGFVGSWWERLTDVYVGSPATCGCYLLQILGLYFTWLSGEGCDTTQIFEVEAWPTGAPITTPEHK